MADDADVRRSLLAKIERLPREQLPALEAFVNDLGERQADRRLVSAYTIASLPAFAAAWTDEDDGIYDDL